MLLERVGTALTVQAIVLRFWFASVSHVVLLLSL